MTNFLEKVLSDKDLKETGFNFTAAFIAGKVASTISNAFFHFDLNRYNSIDHFAMGVGIGTLTYRKAGGGTKGVIAGLAAATMFNASWECFENLYVFKNYTLDIDTISDIAVVYAGTTLSFIGEKLKSYIPERKKYPRGKERWVL